MSDEIGTAADTAIICARLNLTQSILAQCYIINYLPFKLNDDENDNARLFKKMIVMSGARFTGVLYYISLFSRPIKK